MRRVLARAAQVVLVAFVAGSAIVWFFRELSNDLSGCAMKPERCMSWGQASVKVLIGFGWSALFVGVACLIGVVFWWLGRQAEEPPQAIFTNRAFLPHPPPRPPKYTDPGVVSRKRSPIEVLDRG